MSLQGGAVDSSEAPQTLANLIQAPHAPEHLRQSKVYPVLYVGIQTGLFLRAHVGDPRRGMPIE